MNAAVQRPRVVTFAVYFFGILGAIAYVINLGPALVGRPVNTQAAPGLAFVTVGFFCALWMKKGKPTWEGILVGIGVSIVALVVAQWASSINPAH